MRKVLMVATAVVLAGAFAAHAADISVKIGVLTDMSGPYADLGGEGSLDAAKMAVEDFDPARHGMTVEVIGADHLNKPDVASAIARQWYDTEHVDAIADALGSGIALAVSQLTKEKNKAVLISGTSTADLTGKACSPNSVHWTFDTWMLAHGTGAAIVRNGGKTWFFVTADYAGGKALEAETAAVVRAAGGKVLGDVRAPLNTADFSSFLLQAQASKAQVIGLANAGTDTTNAIKQAAELHIVQGGQRLAGLLVYLTDIHALGLQTAQGLTITTAFYWDLNDNTRAFARRFAKRNGGKYPNMIVAGVYSSVLHYLEAVKQVGSAADGAKVVAAMKATNWDDPLFGPTSVRLDGRAIHATYLVEVKKPLESKGPYDYFKILATIPPDQSFRPLAEEKGVCYLVR